MTAAVLNITVNAANDVPVATGNTVIAAEDVPVVIGAGAFSFSRRGTPATPSSLGDHHDGLTLNGGTLDQYGGHGPGDQRHDGDRWRELADLTFTSALERPPTPAFTYTVNDAGLGVTSAVLNITVNADQ